MYTFVHPTEMNVCLPKDMYKNIRSRFLRNSPKLEIVPAAINIEWNF